MRTTRSHKLDPLAFLVVVVTVGMLVTSAVHAKDYLFTDPVLLEQLSQSSSNYVDPVANIIPESQHSWLVPGAKGMRTTIRGGMAHIQFDSRDEGEYSSWLPEETRFIFSMGVEEASQTDDDRIIPSGDEVFDRYVPRLYISIGHRW